MLKKMMYTRGDIQKQLNEMNEKGNLMDDLQIDTAVLESRNREFKDQERILMEKEQTPDVVSQLRHIIEVKAKNKKELDEKEDLMRQLDKEYYLHKTFVKDAVKDETDILLKMSEEGRLKYRQLAADRSEQNKKVANVKEKLTTLSQAKTRSSFQNG